MGTDHKWLMVKDSRDSYNEDVDLIKVVTPEDFIKSQIQTTAKADLE